MVKIGSTQIASEITHVLAPAILVVTAITTSSKDYSPKEGIVVDIIIQCIINQNIIFISIDIIVT